MARPPVPRRAIQAGRIAAILDLVQFLGDPSIPRGSRGFVADAWTAAAAPEADAVKAAAARPANWRPVSPSSAPHRHSPRSRTASGRSTRCRSMRSSSDARSTSLAPPSLLLPSASRQTCGQHGVSRRRGAVAREAPREARGHAHLCRALVHAIEDRIPSLRLQGRGAARALPPAGPPTPRADGEPTCKQRPLGMRRGAGIDRPSPLGLDCASARVVRPPGRRYVIVPSVSIGMSDSPRESVLSCSDVNFWSLRRRYCSWI